MAAFNPKMAKMNSSVSNPVRGQASCRMCSFVLHLLVLALHECSGFAPHSSVPTLRDRPTAVPTTATASQGTMDLLALFATDATAESSTAPTVTSSYSQKFRAESEASGRVLTKHDQKWWTRFGELEEYKGEHGDCNVPFHYTANPQLGRWVRDQRQNYKKNNLSSERNEALESVGFEWTRPKGGQPDDALWWKQLQELEKYKREHGDTLVQTYARGDSDNKYRELGRWVDTQRTQYRFLQEGKHSHLTDERIENLNQIGFVWNAQKAAWEEKFAELVSYKEMHGDTLVRHGSQLGRWVATQRNQYQLLQKGMDSQLTDERIENLNQIGFVWDAQEAAWDEKFAELVSYKEMHGNTLVRQGSKLGNWVSTQRDLFRLLQEGKHSHLTDERIQRLNQIGFVWDAHEAAWEENFAELVEFKATHGHTDVPRSWKSQQLFQWVSKQRREYRKLKEGKKAFITEERIERLNQIGFVWSAREAAWEEKFAELVEFKATHDHTDVPSSWEDQELFWWVSVQRREYKKFKGGKPTQITEERIERLESIGFEWRSKNTYQWMVRLGELRDFYDENGVVPIPQAKHPNLYQWARNQKKEYDKFVRGEETNMDEDRIKDLENIGFFDVYGK